MKIWQTGSGLGLLPSICMTWKYSGHFRISNSKIMKSIGAWASLAFLVTVAAAHPNCGRQPPSGCNAIRHEPEVVTYGEPCYCKESFPVTIEVPESVPEPVETLRSYGYSVDAPSRPGYRSSLQLPVKIQTPIVKHSHRDHLSGRSYGVSVQHEPQRYAPQTYSFDIAVQRPVPAKRVYKPSMSFEVHRHEERVAPRYAPLPCAVQTPIRTEVPETRLVGLTSRVDRVLVPACEYDNCPYCKDVSRVCDPKPVSSPW